MSFISDLTGASGVVEAVTGFVAKFFPDKTQQEKDAAAQALQQLVGEQAQLAAQTAIDLAEAQSSDKINHWRGGLGWACTFGFGWHYVGLPFLGYVTSVLVALLQAFGYKTAVPVSPDLSASSLDILWQLAAIMLGSHAVPGITAAFKKS